VSTLIPKAVKRNQSVEKVMRIIERMAETRGPMRLQDVSHFAELPASTTLRFLNTLMQMGYVTQSEENQRYSLTFKLCGIAEQIRTSYGIRDIIHPALEELTQEIGESSCLAVEESREVVYVDVVEGPGSMLQTLQRIGKRAPLHSTGVGKSLLLNYSPAEIVSLEEEMGLPALTRNTIRSVGELKKELEKVAKQGFAMDDEECEEGVRCVAAPIRDYTGKVVCSVSISGPISRMNGERVEEVARRLGEKAAWLSTRLGYQPAE
jgi:IclR family transcriptional regulator, KDG regulon repressor